MNDLQESKKKRLPFPKAVLWDWDGVVVDTISVHSLATKQVMALEGMPFDPEYYRLLVGYKDNIVIDLMVRNVSPDIQEDEVYGIFQRKHSLYQKYIKDGYAKPFPGVDEWVNYFAEKGIPQIIASSTTLENINLGLAHLPFSDCFGGIISGGPNIKGKPEPDIFLLGSQKLKVKPENCLVLEDTPHGVQAAKRAGMYCIAITNTWQAEDFHGEADIIVETLKGKAPEDIFSLEDMDRQRDVV